MKRCGERMGERDETKLDKEEIVAQRQAHMTVAGNDGACTFPSCGYVRHADMCGTRITKQERLRCSI